MVEKMTLRDVLGYHKRMAAVAAMDEHRLDVMRKHGAMADAIDAYITQPAQAVDVGAIQRSDVWVVQDEAGHPIHCAGWPQACREHIREAINEHGIEEARAWKVLHYTNGATA